MKLKEDLNSKDAVVIMLQGELRDNEEKRALEMKDYLNNATKELTDIMQKLKAEINELLGKITFLEIGNNKLESKIKTLTS